MMVGLYALNAQNNSSFINHIHLNSIKSTYSKNTIPHKYFGYIGITSIADLADPEENWNAGCTRFSNLPNKRFNWMAKDKKGYVFICISTGGIGVSTSCYFIHIKRGINLRFGHPNGVNDWMDFYNKLKSNQVDIKN